MEQRSSMTEVLLDAEAAEAYKQNKREADPFLRQIKHRKEMLSKAKSPLQTCFDFYDYKVSKGLLDSKKAGEKGAFCEEKFRAYIEKLYSYEFVSEMLREKKKKIRFFFFILSFHSIIHFFFHLRSKIQMERSIQGRKRKIYS